MSKLFSVIVILLALNFLALAGGVGWLVKEKRLGKEQVAEIKKILFPPPAPEVPQTQPAEADPATQPFLKLDALLAEKSGLPVGQQVEFIQQTFDAKMAEIDRRQRELLALKDQVERAQRELDSGRGQLLQAEQAVNDREQEAARLAADKGFQESLKLYNSLPARKVKEIFATLEEPTVVRYLKAMDPRVAGKVLKDCKTPAEVARAQRYLELLRQSQPPTPAAPQAASAKE